MLSRDSNFLTFSYSLILVFVVSLYYRYLWNLLAKPGPSIVDILLLTIFLTQSFIQNSLLYNIVYGFNKLLIHPSLLSLAKFWVLLLFFPPKLNKLTILCQPCKTLSEIWIGATWNRKFILTNNLGFYCLTNPDQESFKLLHLSSSGFQRQKDAVPYVVLKIGSTARYFGLKLSQAFTTGVMTQLMRTSTSSLCLMTVSRAGKFCC